MEVAEANAGLVSKEESTDSKVEAAQAADFLLEVTRGGGDADEDKKEEAPKEEEEEEDMVRRGGMRLGQGNEKLQGMDGAHSSFSVLKFKVILENVIKRSLWTSLNRLGPPL